MERTIMESFNIENSYEQKLRFLNQKYASLLSGRTDKWKENFVNKLNSSLEDGDKLKDLGNLDFKNEINDTGGMKKDMFFDLCQQGLLEVLSKITDIHKLDDVVSMLSKSLGSQSKDKSLDDFNTILLNSLLIDLEEYKKTKQSIKDIESETTNSHNNKMLFGVIADSINQSLKEVLQKGKGFLEEEKQNVIVKLNKFENKYDEDGNLIEQESFDTDNGSGDNLNDSIRKNFINPIVFFHTVQRIYDKYNYVVTAEELGKLKQIFSDIKKGKMVFLTGDTGSGKTELCLLISNLYLDEIYGEGNIRKGKEPLIVTGNSETDFSDFTMEKIVTSENSLSSSDDALNKDETIESKVKEFIDNMNKEKAFRLNVKDVIEKNEDLSEDEKKQLCEQVDKEDLLEYHIFTKYHLQGIIKAMKLGVPLIIDEMNGIRPEVLLGLNHYFTRKVGQEVSLGNGFSPIVVKEGFCIMCTGNDKDENSNAKRYKGRYSIDESLMNRMHRLSKGYHKQEIKKFNNQNAGDIESNVDMLDYMTKNELYGVILMLLFSKRGNLRFNNIKPGNFNVQSAVNLLTSTEIAAFDIIKEKFVNLNSNEEKKKNFFGELTKLASFIKMLQNAFQGKTTLCGGVDVRNMMENSQGFSMRDLLNVINSYKSDTKSLWYHLYNDYIKQIPEDNAARQGAYLIAKEVGFLDSNINIDGNISDITTDIENLLQKEKQTSGENDNFELMDIHNKKLEINKNLLTEGRLIITKQDIYKEYFGDKFSDGIDIGEDAISAYKEKIEQQNIQQKEQISFDEDINNYSEDSIITFCGDILECMKPENKESYSNFFNKLSFINNYILQNFCESHSDEKFVQQKNYNQETLNNIGKALSIIENLMMQDGDIDETEYKAKIQEAINLLSSV